MTASVASWVPARNTGGATPASHASSQRLAQRHHRSPGLRPLKPKSGFGVEQVVPAGLREGEELLGHLRAHRVHTEVLRAGVAAAGPVEAGQRGERAALQLTSEDVAGGGGCGSRSGRGVHRRRTLRRSAQVRTRPSTRSSSASAAPGSSTLMVVIPIARAGLRLTPRSSRKTQSAGSTSSSRQAIS